MATDEYKTVMDPIKYLKGDTKVGIIGTNKPENFDREIYELKKNLSPNRLSSVYVVNDNKNPRLFKILIFGEKDTVYSNCGFIFTIQLRPNYPQDSPEVRFETQLPDSQILSPFLFTQGRVLLPILGNFFEDITTNSWNETTMLYQIIDDLRKLFCIDNPYYANVLNSEDRENPDSEIKNKTYNQRVRMISVAEGIVELLQNEDFFETFGRVAIFHYLVKNKEMLDTLFKWQEEYDDSLDDTSKVYKGKSFKTWMTMAEDLLKSHKEKYVN